jgi:RNA-directed DNA polymerase
MQVMQAHKVHSLIGQVYDPRNLARAWERVKENKGSGGVDGVTVTRFEEKRDFYLDLLQQRLKDGSYRPRPVRRVEIDKPGSVAKRALGIPTVMDRVCQQAVVQILEPIFEPTFRDESFGFRPGRSTHMAMRRIWRQLKAGNSWVVDADIADFFGTLSHSTLVDLVAKRVADGKVLRLLWQFLEAGVLRDGQVEPTLTGVPQGGVASPLLSNVYLHVFDEKMAEAGLALTRFADDWVITCKTRRDAERALTSARAVLEGELGLRVHPDKTRIVYVAQGFEFLGYKIKQGERRLRYRQAGPDLYAYPRDRTIERFKKRVRQITNRRNPKKLGGLLDELNPVIRGWGNYYRRAHVRRLFHRLDGWILRRIWSWRYKRWRCRGWQKLPRTKLYGELGLVNLLQLIPSMASYYRQKGYSR